MARSGLSLVPHSILLPENYSARVGACFSIYPALRAASRRRCRYE